MASLLGGQGQGQSEQGSQNSKKGLGGILGGVTDTVGGVTNTVRHLLLSRVLARTSEAQSKTSVVARPRNLPSMRPGEPGIGNKWRGVG
ncbi:hypothetical protein I308_103518 [Cryptococcus tetragattii IND107]|uniref:Uncharacterized protein n=1 Tax=Cryptococcus tetragattii IND107 TaxID=1296105 RepID=A0ABR3BTD1_9TREE